MPAFRAAFLKAAIAAARRSPDKAAFQFDSENVDSHHRELMTNRFQGKVSVSTIGPDYRFTVSVDGDQTHSSPPGTWDQGLEWLTAMQQRFEAIDGERAR